MRQKSQFSGIHGIDYIIPNLDRDYERHMFCTDDGWMTFTHPGYDTQYFIEKPGPDEVEKFYFPRPCLDEITMGMFSIPFSEFVEFQPKYKRAHRHAYTHNNLINLYFGGLYPTNRNTVTVEICGKYFEKINWDQKHLNQTCDYADSLKAQCKGFHSFVDDRSMILPPFGVLQTHIIEHKFRSDYSKVTMFPGTSDTSVRAFRIGAGNCVMNCYESGKHRRKETPEMNLENLRVEMQLRAEEAEAAYHAWRNGTEIYHVTMSRIKNHISFLPMDCGKNRAASRADPVDWWERFTADAVPFKLVKPKKEPDEEQKLDSILRYTRKAFKNNDPAAVFAVITQAMQDELGGDVSAIQVAISNYLQAL